jgi:ABC-type sulfate/molybdate transport systems ATPase subunit
MRIQIEHVSRRFGEFVALDRVSLNIESGEFLALLGPSGSGKTTLLRVIAGLERIDEGAVRFEGEDITGQSPRERNVGLVFQHYALFRHMTVFDTDEPFGALDAKVRKELRLWLRKLHDEMGLTSIFVTHDQDEAIELADRIAVMNHGRIEQIGTPKQIYDDPANPFVYEFVGTANRFDAVAQGGQILAGSDLIGRAPRQLTDGPVTAFSRPHDISLLPAQERYGVPATIQSVTSIGGILRLKLESPASRQLIEVELSKGTWVDPDPEPGTPVRLRLGRFSVFRTSSDLQQLKETVPELSQTA